MRMQKCLILKIVFVKKKKTATLYYYYEILLQSRTKSQVLEENMRRDEWNETTN